METQFQFMLEQLCGEGMRDAPWALEPSLRLSTCWSKASLQLLATFIFQNVVKGKLSPAGERGSRS